MKAAYKCQDSSSLVSSIKGQLVIFGRISLPWPEKLGPMISVDFLCRPKHNEVGLLFGSYWKK